MTMAIGSIRSMRHRCSNPEVNIKIDRGCDSKLEKNLGRQNRREGRLGSQVEQRITVESLQSFAGGDSDLEALDAAKAQMQS